MGQGTTITATTIVGGVMLLLSILFLVIGVRRARKGRKLIGGQENAGIFILMGFALLAMGSLTFLFGTFRPGP